MTQGTGSASPSAGPGNPTEPALDAGRRVALAPLPAQLVLGFCNLGERSIAAGVAAMGDLLRG